MPSARTARQLSERAAPYGDGAYAPSKPPQEPSSQKPPAPHRRTILVGNGSKFTGGSQVNPRPQPTGAGEGDRLGADRGNKLKAYKALLQKEQAFQVQQVVLQHRHREELQRLREKHGLPADGHEDQQKDNAIAHLDMSMGMNNMGMNMNMNMDVVDTPHPFTATCNVQDRGNPDLAFYPLYPVIDQRDSFQAAVTGPEQACMTTVKHETPKHIIYSGATNANRKNRGRYRCSKCGAAKAGHICKFKKMRPGDLLKPKRPSITWVRSVSTQADTALTGATGRALADLPDMPLTF